MADLYRRCGCRDEHGKTLGNRCPKLENAKHGAWAFYLAAGTDPVTGKRRQVRQGGYPTKQAAQKARNDAAVKLDRGTYVAPTRELYGAHVLHWLDHHEKTGRGLKASTMVNYRRYVNIDIAPSRLGSVPLSEVRRFHVNAFIKQLLDDGRGATTVPPHHRRCTRLPPLGGRREPHRPQPRDRTQAPDRAQEGARGGSPLWWASSSTSPPDTGSRRCSSSRCSPACAAASYSACAGRTST